MPVPSTTSAVSPQTKSGLPDLLFLICQVGSISVPQVLGVSFFSGGGHGRGWGEAAVLHLLAQLEAV